MLKEINIKEFLETHYSIEYTGNKALCPFHSEKTPSFVYKEETNRVTCYGSCNENWDIVSFVMKYEGLNFQEAKKKIQNLAGVSEPKNKKKKKEKINYKDYEAALDRYIDVMCSYMKDEDYYYFSKRGFSIDFSKSNRFFLTKSINVKSNFSAKELLHLQNMKLITESKDTPYIKYKGRYCFPLQLETGLTFQGRAIREEVKPKYITPAILRKGLYINSMTESEYYIIEGIIDTWKGIKRYGENKVIGLLGGSNLDRLSDLPAEAKYYLLMDNDKAGAEYTRKIIQKIKSRKIKIARFPAGKDFDDCSDLDVVFDDINDEQSIKMPDKYSIEDGLYYDGKKVSSQVIIPVSESTDRDGVHYVKLKCTIDNRERIVIVPSSSIAKKSEILKLNDSGIYITEKAAPHQSQFLVSYLEVNHEVLETSGKVIHDIGFRDGYFYLPDRIIMKDGVDYDVWMPSGGQLIQSMFKAKGKVEEWRKAIDIIQDLSKNQDCNIAAFCIYLAFASPFNSLMCAKNLIVHLHRKSGKGKTTILKVCVSIFGDPNGELFTDWNTTPAAFKRMPAVYQIVLFLDEFTTIDKRMCVQDLLYILAEGKEKTKAKQHGRGLVDSGRYFFNTISTGETQIINPETSHTGLTVRLLQFENEVFGGSVEKDFFRQIEKITTANHGVALESFVSHVLRNGVKFERKDFLCESEVETLSTQNTRLYEELRAAFSVACEVESFFNFGFDCRDVFRSVFLSVTKTVDQYNDLGGRFLDGINDYITQQITKFPEIEFPAMGSAKASAGKSGEILGFIDGDDLLMTPTRAKAAIMEFMGGNHYVEVKRELEESGRVKTMPPMRILIDDKPVNNRLIRFLGILTNEDIF